MPSSFRIFLPVVIVVGLLYVGGLDSLFADTTAPVRALKPIPEPMRAGVEAINETDLRAWLSFLAAPELEGREAGKKGYDIAALFCASIFQQYGIKPAGDEVDGKRSYHQRFSLLKLEQDTKASTLEIASGDEKKRFEIGKQFSTLLTIDLDWKGVPALLGTGKELFKGSESISAENHIPMVLLVRGESAPDTAMLEKAGHRRVLAISNQRARMYGFLSRRQMPAYKFHQSYTETKKGVDIVYVTTAVADHLLAAQKTSCKDLEERLARGEKPTAIEFAGATLQLTRKIASRTELPTSNVLGLIEGADEKLKNEIVVVGAHLDHVGAHDDKIFHGADDNASGSAGVLALGRAFTLNSFKPRRSILLMLYGAEEKGLIGSEYFVKHPTVPLDRIIAKINLDMIGRDEERTSSKKNPETAAENKNSVHVVGSRRRSYRLHSLLLENNDSIGLDFEYDEERVYRRSDQFHFSEAGIPFVFLFTGFHADYHKPTDTIDKINYPKMTRIIRLAYMMAHRLADREGKLQPSMRF